MNTSNCSASTSENLVDSSQEISWFHPKTIKQDKASSDDASRFPSVFEHLVDIHEAQCFLL
jgi:hypothetical protein